MPETTSGLGTRTRLQAAEPDAGDGLDCSVTLSRDHPRDCGLRQVYARIDDGAWLTFVHGQSTTIEVKPGAHILKVDNTLFRKRLAFTIEPGEHLEFSILNYARWWTAGVVGAFGWAPIFLSVRKTSLQ